MHKVTADAITMDQSTAPTSQASSRARDVFYERERGVYALRVLRDVAHAVVRIPAGDSRTDAIQNLFNTVAKAGIPLFLIKLHRSSVTFALAGAYLERAAEVLQAAGYDVSTRRDLAMVTVVASSMREMAGIMVDIADALYEAGARIYEAGDSHDTVQCLIEAHRVPTAIEQLCKAFHLDKSAVQEEHLPIQELPS
jgi:aspartokinase